MFMDLGQLRVVQIASLLTLMSYSHLDADWLLAELLDFINCSMCHSADEHKRIAKQQKMPHRANINI